MLKNNHNVKHLIQLFCPALTWKKPTERVYEKNHKTGTKQHQTRPHATGYRQQNQLGAGASINS